MEDTKNQLAISFPTNGHRGKKEEGPKNLPAHQHVEYGRIRTQPTQDPEYR